MSAPKIAILFNAGNHSLRLLAEAEKRGVESAGGSADLFSIAEFKVPIDNYIHDKTSPESSTHKTIEPLGLPANKYNAVIAGVASEHGALSMAWRTFWDKTGRMWMDSRLDGVPVGVFVSTKFPRIGQETTITTFVSTLVHHGCLFVPPGYKYAADALKDTSEVHGGSPLGAGTFTVSSPIVVKAAQIIIVPQGENGERKPSIPEITQAEAQGRGFFEAIKDLNIGMGRDFVKSMDKYDSVKVPEDDLSQHVLR